MLKKYFILILCSACLTNVAWADTFDSSKFNANKGPLRILRIVPSGEKAPAGRQIVIQFNRPVVPVGRMERRADEIPVNITPALACEWRWLNTSSLACQLGDKKGLKPATKYNVVVKPGIKTEDGKTIGSDYKHSFTTERPRVRYTSFKRWQGPDTPQIIVQFNQTVKREAVAAHLYIQTVDGRRIALSVKEDPAIREALKRARTRGKKWYQLVWIWLKDNGRRLIFWGKKSDEDLLAYINRSWLIQPVEKLGIGKQVKLMVEPGIISGAGPEPGDEARVLVNFNTFPVFSYLGLRCQTNNRKSVMVKPGDNPKDYACNPLAGKSLVFSAPIGKETLQKHLKVTPDLAGGRKDYDPWANVYSSNYLSYPHRKNRTYAMSLPSGLKAYQLYSMKADASSIRDMFNRPLAESINTQFFTDHRPPEFVLNHEVSVLEKSVKTHLPVVVTNLKSIFLNYQVMTANGAIQEKVTTLPVAQAEDIAFHFPIKIRNLIPGKSGIVQGRWDTTPSVENRSPWDLPRWFFSQVTPFNVHTKIGHHNTIVWVTRLDTGKPVANAQVHIYTDRLGRFAISPPMKATAITNKDGIARLPGTRALDPSLKLMGAYRRDREHLFVRVAKNDDIALLPLINDFYTNEYGANDSYISTYLRKRYDHIRSWGFTAQGVYKLGDKVEFKLYVRDQDNKRLIPAPRTAYKLKVYSPTGKIVHQASNISLSNFGSYAGKFVVPKTAAVGWYRFDLRASYTKKTWQPLRVLISDFTPSPFRVYSDIKGDLFKAKDSVKILTQAKMHAGGPFANAKARITARINATSMRTTDPKAQGFYFDVYSRGPRSHTVHQENKTVDANGELNTNFTIPDSHILYGRLSIESAVSDDRGKYVAGQSSAKYVGRDRYIGIRQPEWLLKANKPAKVMTLVVNERGKVTAKTDVEVIIKYRETKASRVKGAGNAYLTHYVHEWVEVKKCEYESKDTASVCNFTPKKAGYYMMTASIEDTKGRVHASTTNSWAQGPGEVMWETSPGNVLQVIPEKTEYKVGDIARYLVQNPYPGAKALVTIERYGVQKSWVTTLKTGAEVIKVPITADHLPGFYLSVIVMSPRVDKPLGKGQVDLGKPAFRMGYVRVPVKDPYKEIKITVKPLQKQYKPGATVTVDLQAKTRQGKVPPMEIAVAVLDESVFDLIKGGKSYYDPYKAFYSLESLDLKNFNLLTRIIGRQKFEKKGANPGGGGLMKRKAYQKMAGTRTRSIFKYLSYWNAVIKPDALGKARVTFKAPDNLTGWRVLAVAVTPSDRMGLGDGNFKVNQATEIRPTLPNQVTEGDQFEARFTVMNRTKRARTLTITIKANGALKQAARTGISKTVKVKVAPYERHTVGIPLQAGPSGKIDFVVKAGDASDADAVRLSLKVHKKMALETAATYGTSTKDSVTENILFPKNIRTDVGRISVVTSPSVIANLEGAFKYLKKYPYVCWEQRLTKGVMASHYRDLKAYLPKQFIWKESAGTTKAMLAQAANFQAPNGGMVYYIPTNSRVSPYLSAYTALAFNWMRRSGHQIPAQVENRLHRYLLGMLRRNVFPDFYSPGMSSTVRAVALAALADRGKVTLDDLQRYRRHVSEMSLFGKAHYLQALTRVSGTAEIQKEVMDLIRSHANETGGKYVFSENLDFAYKRILDSSGRTQCAVLSSFLDYENSSKGGNTASDVPFKLVRTITQMRKQRNRWENTQENMFCMNALIDYSRVYEKTTPNMTLTALVGGKSIGSTKFQSFRDKPKDFERPIKAGDPGRKIPVSLKRQGQGRYYYATRLFYSPKKLKTNRINAGIDVRREYSVEREGKWILLKSPMQIKSGELVRVDLFVSLPAARNFVVVDDPIPGGLEPVNRDLATASTVDSDKAKGQYAGGSFWYKFSDWRAYSFSYWSFYHKELRHHAARFYSEYLPAGNYHLSYVAQAIAPGKFTVMPVHAEEMYNPDTFGQGLPATLKVEVAK